VDSVSFGAVHSVFDHAVNLTMGEELWTLLTASKADLPLGIRVTLASFDAHRLRRGEAVHIRAGFLGIGSRFVVDCRTASRWTPAKVGRLTSGLADRLAVVGEAARTRSWPESARLAHAVQSALGDVTVLNRVLRQVVGRGPGATPSGDDVLVGALAVLTSPYSGNAGQRAAAALTQSLRPFLSTTTDLSRHLLRQAMKGLFSRDIHELVATLIQGSSARELAERARQVINTGATSGADTCEGLVEFASSYFGGADGRALR
jgi:hypothetical protein